MTEGSQRHNSNIDLFPSYNSFGFNNNSVDDHNNQSLGNDNNMGQPGPSKTEQNQKNVVTGRIILVEGDGRCLFRSLVTCLSPELQKAHRDDFGSPFMRNDRNYETLLADVLRARVVKLMSDNVHFYGQLEQIVLNADQPVPAGYSHFHDRLKDMTLTTTMPGDLELNATSMALERPVLVLDVNLRPIFAYGRDHFPKSECLVVRYTRLGPDVGHYDCILPDQGTIQAMGLAAWANMMPKDRSSNHSHKVDAKDDKKTMKDPPAKNNKYDCFGHLMKYHKENYYGDQTQGSKNEHFDKSTQVTTKKPNSHASNKYHKTTSKKVAKSDTRREINTSNNKKEHKNNAENIESSSIQNLGKSIRGEKNDSSKIICSSTPDITPNDTKRRGRDTAHNNFSQTAGHTSTEQVHHSESKMDFLLFGGSDPEEILIVPVLETDKNNCRQNREDGVMITETSEIFSDEEIEIEIKVKRKFKPAGIQYNRSKVKRKSIETLTDHEYHEFDNILCSNDNTKRHLKTKPKKKMRPGPKTSRQKASRNKFQNSAEIGEIGLNNNRNSSNQRHTTDTTKPFTNDDTTDLLNSDTCLIDLDNVLFIPAPFENKIHEKCFLCKKDILNVSDALTCTFCKRGSHLGCIPGLDQASEDDLSSTYCCYYCSLQIGHVTKK